MNYRNRNDMNISLLKYALGVMKIDAGQFHIGFDGEEVRINDKVCLLTCRTNKWRVFYIERGCVMGEAFHSSFEYACKDFYSRLVGYRAHFEFLSEWEEETGLDF